MLFSLKCLLTSPNLPISMNLYSPSQSDREAWSLTPCSVMLICQKVLPALELRTGALVSCCGQVTNATGYNQNPYSHHSWGWRSPTKAPSDEGLIQLVRKPHLPDLQMAIYWLSPHEG